MRLRSPLTFVTAVGSLLVATSVRADDVASSARFRLDPVHPASAHSPFFVIEGPVRSTGASLPWFAGNVIVDYARSPLSLDIHDPVSGNRTVPLVDDAFVLHANLAAYLTNSLALDLSWSVAALQIGENEPVGIREFKAPGSGAIGDVRIGALHRDWFSDTWGYVAGVRAWAPTGNEQDYMSDGRFRFEVLAGVFASTENFDIGCNAFGSPLFSSKESGERIGGGCAAHLSPSEHGPHFGAEVWGGALYVHPDLNAGSLFEYMGTVGQDAGALRLSLGVGRGAGNSPGTSARRMLAMVGIVPPTDIRPKPKPNLDLDMDAIPNDVDACPDEAGPSSNDVERNGCPSRDSDGDGVEDLVDACPDEKGIMRAEQAASGCPDRDNDHVVDKLDRCPEQPAPPSDDPTQRGCPKHARISGDQLDLSPALDPFSVSERGVEQIVLREVAFILRAMPELTKVAVEVRIATPKGQDEAEGADLAVERAQSFVQRLVRLGVESSRLEPIGILTKDESSVRLFIIERADPHKAGR